MKGSDSIHDLMGMQDPSAVGPPFAQAEGVKRAVFAVIVLSVAMVWWWPRPWAAASDMPSQAELQRRDEALAGAKIFDRKAELQVGDVGLAVDFSKDPNQDLINPQLTTCTFVPTDTSGTTPKFDCRLQGGEKIKVKYGWTREIPVEVAATRLLHALGFGADQMSRVAVVRCFGCVVSPFHVRALAQMLHLGDAFDRHINYNHAIDFVNVAVERKLQGNGVEPRAGENRPGAGRRKPRGSGRTATDGCVSESLGQQRPEPATAVRRRSESALQSPPRHDSGHRFRSGAKQAESGQLAPQAHLER